MNKYVYHPQGTCSTEMDFIIDEDNRVQGLEVIHGCNGNLKGISSLIKGMKIEDVIDRLKGIKCGMKPTSCPDQIATALEQYKENHAE